MRIYKNIKPPIQGGFDVFDKIIKCAILITMKPNIIIEKDCKKCDIIKKNNDTMRKQAARIVELKNRSTICTWSLKNTRKRKADNTVLAYNKWKK